MGKRSGEAKINGETMHGFRSRLLASGEWESFAQQRDLLCESENLTPFKASSFLRRNVFQPQASPSQPKPDEGDHAAKPGIEAPRSAFKSPETTNFRATVLWVFDNLAIEDARPEDAPSPGAWALLEHVKLSPSNRAAFYSGFVARLLTGSKEDARGRAIDDDGSDLDPWLESWLGIAKSEAPAVLLPGAEDGAGELDLAPEDGPAVPEES